MPHFLCLWWPHFPAWAAQQGEPRLRDRPLLVYQAGRIIAVSLEAQQAGAQVGWTLHRAQAQLRPSHPNTVFWPLHGPTVNRTWEAVLTALLDFTPCLESPRPGSLMADVRPPRALLPLLRTWQAQGGAGRAGVAQDRATAELAAYSTTPGTLRTIRQGYGTAFLSRSPLSLLSPAGIREETLERLQWFGWRTLGDLASLTQRQLVAQFDQGALLFRYAQAGSPSADQRPVGYYRQPPTVNISFTFDTPVREPREWEAVLSLLIEQNLTALQGRGAQAVAVTIASTKGSFRCHRLLPALTDAHRSFYEVARHLLLELTKASSSFFSLEVQLAALQPLPSEQGQLFGRNRPPVSVAAQAIEARFPGALRRIVWLDRNAYLPETAFRFEPITTEHKQPLPKPRKSGRSQIGRANRAAAKPLPPISLFE